MPATPFVSLTRAGQHEALWLRLTALHKDLATLAARRAALPVGGAVRSAAEAILSDCAPFAGGDRLPAAAEDAAGLLVQLGQALARLDAFEATHSFWNPKLNCRCWRVREGQCPVQRLRPQLPPPPTTYKGENIRDKLGTMISRRWQQAYEDGFQAGRAARIGPPETPEAPGLDSAEGQTYPHIRSLG